MSAERVSSASSEMNRGKHREGKWNGPCSFRVGSLGGGDGSDRMLHASTIVVLKGCGEDEQANSGVVKHRLQALSVGAPATHPSSRRPGLPHPFDNCRLDRCDIREVGGVEGGQGLCV